MNFSVYLGAIFVAACLGWASWVIVFFKLSPYESPNLALALFYSSLFIALTASFGLLGYYLRVWLYHNEVYFHYISTSLRQGALFSVMICAGLIFQRMRILNWWDALLLFVLVVVIELYFMTREH